MAKQTIYSGGNKHQIDLDNDKLVFKTTSFIQNDLLLSLLYFGLILFLPLIIWNHVDQTLIPIWQGCMITISAARWLCRLAFTKKIQPFWVGTLTFLTLLDGLGWGILAALLFPVDSILAISLTALFLVGIGAAGAVSYSARMLIAIPYFLCVILPYTTRLFLDGGSYEFLIASTLILLTILFSFVTDRLNIALTSALNLDRKDDEADLNMIDEISHLEKNIEKTENRSIDLEDQLTKNSREMEDVHKAISQYSEELNLLAGKSINLLNDLESLKQTRLDHNQNKLIKKIEENARHLSNTLNEPENEQALFDNTNNNEAPETIPVLVVNDDKQETKNIEACLQDLNLDSQRVENVPAALATLCQAEANHQNFDIIIANLWMPEMDGVSFAECLQDDPEFREIKLIMLTTGEESCNKRLQNSGISQIIKKPFQREELINVINQLLAKESTSLPASIGALIDDAIRVSIPPTEQTEPENSSSLILDEYVISGLRSSTTINFIEVVNDYLEEAPQLIKQAKEAYKEKEYSDIKNTIRELGSRSLHMGAIGLVDSAKIIEETIDQGGIERVMGMLQHIDAGFIQVESALLAELTNGTFLSDNLRH